MSSLAKGFVLGGLEVGENCAWCLVIVVIFMRVGGAEVGLGWGGGGMGGGF